MNTENLLVSSLANERIQVKSPVGSRKRLLEATASLLTKGLHEEAKEKDIYHLLLEREKLGNTGIGNGVAIPHSRCNFTEQAVVSIITVEQPIDYDSLDRQPVEVAFGLLVPQEANQDHLNLLANIAKLMSNDSHRNALTSATEPDEIIHLISGWHLSS